MAYSDRFTNYLSLFTLVLSSAMFLLAKACLRGREQKGKLLPLLSGISFCVYLIHPLALGVGERLWGHFTGLAGPNTILTQILFYLCVTLFCIVAAFVLSSLKPFCYLFTGQNWSTACRSCNLFALVSRRTLDK